MNINLAHTFFCQTGLEIQSLYSEGKISNWDTSGGFKIVTRNPQDGSILMFVFEIVGSQNCCEQYGFIEADASDLEYHTGSLLNKIEVFEVKDSREYDEGGAVFINLHTTKGVLTLTVYNSQNGYYGHDVDLYSVTSKTGERTEIYATYV